MRNPLIPVAALIAAIPAPAQGDHYTSSPQGYEGVEGDMSVDLIGKEARLRFQQIDAFTLGSKPDRNLVYFRRDGLLPANPAYGTRNIELEMFFGEGDLATAGSDFDANYISGTKQQVINRQTINFVDWTVNPATPPQNEANATFLLLDNQHSYAGKTASGTDWVWEIKVHQNDQAGNAYPMDADSVMPGSITNTGHTVAAGCFGNSQINLTNHGTHMSIFMDIIGGAPNSGAAMLIGGSTLTFQVPGWNCPFETLPVGVITMPNTDVTGFSSLNLGSITYNAGIIGGPIYGQSVVLDDAAPGGISLGATHLTVMPADPPLGSAAGHHWALDPDATNSTSGMVSGGIIMHTNHP